jgi:hypothetical protein
MSGDLTYYYLGSVGGFIALYLTGLIVLEFVVWRRVVGPILDLTAKVKKPKELNTFN